MAVLLCLLGASVFAVQMGGAPAAFGAGGPSLQVSPTAGPVGAHITVTGSGFPPNTSLVLKWSTVNASWVVAGNPPQVTGTKVVPTMKVLGGAMSDGSGALSATLTTPKDYGSSSHSIQAFAQNGSAFSAKVIFTLEPSFKLSTSAGPAGTPITVTATGLGYGLYSTSYHVSWDNTYVGYATALGSRGATNFTIYASGTPGTHYIDIYQGYPGPGYLNPQQGPPAGETQSNFPPLIPFHAEFNVTADSSTSSPNLLSPFTVTFAAAVIVVLAAAQLVASRTGSEGRRGFVRALSIILLVVALAVGGLGLYGVFGGNTSQQSSFTPQATVDRPGVTVQSTGAVSGPRMSVTPTVVSVGDAITVEGAGFNPGTTVPISWTTRQGNNVYGYKLASLPLRNVTIGGDGSFSFSMTVPPDLGGLHFIAAGNLTRNSNATLFLQRSASISATQGPSGTRIVLTLKGVGWDYNTNIVAIDYDNSYFGYACGFNSGGNVTVTVVASGAPGVHTIDIYPSVWWGTSAPSAQLSVEYRYPLLTPQDHPELMPSFHFTFLVTPGP